MERQKILIIDDDPNIRKTLSDILKMKGYEPFLAKNGSEGIDLLRRSSVNLMVLDLGLPDISGLEVLSRAKAVNPSIEAIILTGNASLDSAIEATNKGAFSYLLKPYEMDQLMLNIKRALEKQAARETIIKHTIELESVNTELRALHQVSLAINQTVNMDELFSRVLDVVTKIEMIGCEGKCAAFLVEEDRMRLVFHRGLSRAELEHFLQLQVGENLCGLTAITCGITASGDSANDKRPATKQSTGIPHGYIIVPLKTVNGVVGELCLYARPNGALDERLSNLLLSMGNQIGVAAENIKLYEQTKSHSLHDSLTSLPNRRYLDLQIKKSIEAAKRYGECLSVGMLDIDHFKDYNDSRGHIEGDGLLVKLAGILSREIRASDYVFRYGGEEFLILLPRTDLKVAGQVAERLRESVEAETEVTISIGIAVCEEDMANSEGLINSADCALYQAKRKGRNRVEPTPRQNRAKNDLHTPKSTSSAKTIVKRS
jgi:two-component system, cell cycle response regulator